MALKQGFSLDLLYVGAENGMEKAMVEKEKIEYRGVSCGKLRRYFSWENFQDFFKIPKGIFQAYKILGKFQPEVVFSKGGFVSFPVIVAAYFRRIPTIIHESDVVPGLANRLCFFFAKNIFLSFDESLKYIKKKWHKKVTITGPIVRTDISDGDAKNALKLTKFDHYRPVILAMGGSLGAQQINELIWNSLPELTKRYQIAHITGKGHLNFGFQQRGYKQFEYLGAELKDLYAIADLVITRGGANSLSEIEYLQKKALVIPLGTEVSRGDQIVNAQVFCRRNGWSLLQGDISVQEFIESVELAIKNNLTHDNPETSQRGVILIAARILKTNSAIL